MRCPLSDPGLGDRREHPLPHCGSAGAPTPERSHLLASATFSAAPGGTVYAPGILPRLSGENGPGETDILCHLLAGTDIKSQPLESKQDFPDAPAIRREVMC